ncbi:glycerol-3-phosphate 1-O-acyltransferase PlsY [Brunnivagina elsteri]|uniref:Glycerol-3-phosphate acyltransferase n=1 Tax=Brunnivagina elsteri CCALA 953 TaxID=987040 RepID=A0A2A2TPL2_9CYAN|nr:glycerol-3-phosphate 1-O-acyltransferase PlsY [Calothrix elsteri]PAX60357.1 acyl-phosphate glycerol 3-phosphate acyltransferase [Calothrix elsteri CCALA 953]
MNIWLSLCGIILISAYLLGSIPTGYTAAKLLKGIDIREVGSGSTGATNVLRTLGKGPGAFVLFIDCLKGVISIFLVYRFFEFASNQSLIPQTINPENWQPWMVILAGAFAIIGHSKSIFIGFSGGKSVATSLGLLLAMDWQVGLATLGVFATVVAISRIASLGSICGAIAVPIFIILRHQPLAYILFVVVGGLYVIIRHRSNVQRLMAGTEPKLGQNTAVIEAAGETTNPAN